MLLIDIYNLRWKRKFTQIEVAKATGLSAVTVNKIFKNEPHDFKFSTVEKMAKFLGCNL